MSMQHLLLAALLAANNPSTPAEDPPETAAEAAGKAYWDALQAQMRASTSPLERALAARNTVMDPVGGGKALRAAAQAAPGDALVQMIWSTIGSRWSGCDAVSPCPEQDLAWARVEPDNGLAWTPAFEASAKDGSAAEIDADIARIAAASRFDDHFVDYWQAYRRAIAARPMPQIVMAGLRGEMAIAADAASAREQAAAISAMGYAAALPLPMVSLMRACTRASHPDVPATRFEDCARIGRGIVASDSSVMSKMIGSAIVRASGLHNESDRQARRALDWRQHAAGKAIDDQLHPGSLAAYFSDLASTGDEVRAQELAMARYGIALEPPAEWKPGQ